MGKVIAAVIAVITLLGMAFMSTNPSVPEGHEGYVYENPRMFGSGGYRDIVTGPGNFGISLWKNEVKLLDMRPKSDTTSMHILEQTGLNVSVTATIIMKPKAGTSKLIFEKYNGVKWYSVNFEKRFDASVRDAVQKYQFKQMRANRSAMNNDVLTSMTNIVGVKPFEIISVNIGDITPPKKVLEALELKQAAKETKERKNTEKEIAAMDAEIAVTEAGGIADAQQIINGSLTELFVAYKSLETQREIGRYGNVVQYVPVGNGGIQLVNDVGDAKGTMNSNYEWKTKAGKVRAGIIPPEPVTPVGEMDE